MPRPIVHFLLLLSLFCSLPELLQAWDLSMKPLDSEVLVGRPVTFESRCGHDSNDTSGAQTQWNFGNDDSLGKPILGAKVQHTFSKPGIYPVWISHQADPAKRRLAAIVRVRDAHDKPVPRVLIDSDARCEADDQHFIGYALLSELDILGVNSVHNGPGTEIINHGEIHYVFRLARRSGLSADRVPMAFRGADTKLEIPASGNWKDTQPIVTEASDAVLAAARGASPDHPAWILPVGAGTNVASAILQAREEGLNLKERIRIIWLGGHAKDYHHEHNGHYDPWSVYVMGQSGIDMQILLSHPTSLKLNIDKRVEAGLYPQNDLGKYLLKITPLYQWNTTKPKSLHDTCVLAVVINEALGGDWVTKVEPTYVSGPEKDYSWQPAPEDSNAGDSNAGDSSVRLIWDIDGEAMKVDVFNTLNGNPSHLRSSETAKDDS